MTSNEPDIPVAEPAAEAGPEATPAGAAADAPQASLTAVARVKGELVTTLPEDLYIPPDALQVFLDTFEGPLDLLLYLIRAQNLDILDIPVAKITHQYLEYVEMMRALNFDLAAEYLLMAAW
ncbi:MAG: segregation/condensation protein A, partial [Perlucidibaca sp.]